MQIKDFVHGELKSYVNYDNERNIPNLMDGLKLTQRKVLYAFIKHIGKNKMTCDKGGMRAADLTHYAHGANSMVDVLIKMAQNFPGTNNLPLFDALGQFGNRLDHDYSAPRYISTRLNDNYKKLFDPDDEDILIKQFNEGDEIEPSHYLPKLPLLLINGSKGTGNGFAASVLSYSPGDVREAVKECLKHGYVKTALHPYLEGYTGTVKKDHSTGQVTYTGKLEIKNTTTIVITELPPSVELKDYESHLKKLIEKKLIKDYDNESKEAYWKFVVDCPRTTTTLPMHELLEKFKLIGKDTETLCAWVPDDKGGQTIRTFASVEELIEIWCSFRVEWYEKRRLNLIKRYSEEADWMETKLAFIKWWNNHSDKLVKLKKADLKQAILEQVTFVEAHVDKLLSIRISNLGLEEVEALEQELEYVNYQRNFYETTDKKSMMKEELKNLKF